jgi:uncharacterized protein YegL
MQSSCAIIYIMNDNTPDDIQYHSQDITKQKKKRSVEYFQNVRSDTKPTDKIKNNVKKLSSKIKRKHIIILAAVVAVAIVVPVLIKLADLSRQEIKFS